MPDPNYPLGVSDRNLESDLHYGPDLDAIAEAKAQAEDERYERKQDLTETN